MKSCRYFDEDLTVDEKKQIANKRVGKRIRGLRKSRNHTQKILLDKIECNSQPLISLFERGKKSISAEFLPLIAEYYNTNVESFFVEDANGSYSIIDKCSRRLTSDPQVSERISIYMNKLGDNAIRKVGYAKVFDLIYFSFMMCLNDDSNNDFIVQQLECLRNMKEDGDSFYFKKVLDEANK